MAFLGPKARFWAGMGTGAFVALLVPLGAALCGTFGPPLTMPDGMTDDAVTRASFMLLMAWPALFLLATGCYAALFFVLRRARLSKLSAATVLAALLPAVAAVQLGPMAAAVLAAFSAAGAAACWMVVERRGGMRHP